MTENLPALKARRSGLIEQINSAENEIIELKWLIFEREAKGKPTKAECIKKCGLNAAKNAMQAELSKVNAQIKHLNISTDTEVNRCRISKADRAMAAEDRFHRAFFRQAELMLSEGSFKKIHAAAVEMAVTSKK